MNDLSTRSESVPQSARQAPAYLTSKRRQEHVVLRWWYRLASPREPEGSVTIAEAKRFRRGRTGSQLILALYVLLIIAVPAGLVGTTNTNLIPIVIGSACALFVATVLNRTGQINIAGSLVVLTFVAFPIANIVTIPDGLSILVLPLYGLLVLPLLCAVSFLPAWWVFVVALGNCLFTWLSLMYLPRTEELQALLTINFVGTLTGIILVQLLISVVAYVWVQHSTRELERANRAEEIARLEHDLSLQAEAVARQKRQLEASIQHIIETLMRVANGDSSARVPLTQGNVLWQVS
ncbi:MAG TPA: hypothetical protein VFB12_16735, partial [Ktedonobacteraceae bacterium]|nr:hypothetical protein [Ktedonobacteraceae bacterium]